MSLDVYASILEHAPNDSPAAAGNLHEAIWTELLRRTDPRVHNVRVTKGDGGLDGVAFLDLATAVARVYQAKFFPDLTDKGHKESVVDAFVRAHGHPFVCASWVLLVPRQLSHTDLGWLMGSLKAEAKAEAKKRKGLPAGIDARIDACAVDYHDGPDLLDLLMDNLDVAVAVLPKSELALMELLQQEKVGRSRDRAELLLAVKALREDAIRAHEADARRARAALGILNQNWSNLIFEIEPALAEPKLLRRSWASIGTEAEALASAKSSHAYVCEPFLPGVSELVSDVLYRARVLQQAAVFDIAGAADEGAVPKTAAALVEAIKEVQRRIAEIQRWLLKRG